MPDASQPASPVTLAAAQREMRDAYLGGAPGVLVSATVWCIAGLVCLWRSPQQAVWTLFIGGALIHPLSVVLLKLLKRPGRHASNNPLGPLALSSTVWMIMSLPLAWVASTVRADWFFPAMLLVIGGRYLNFATLYGTRLYWLFGAALALGAWALVSAKASPALGAFTGAAIEAGFGMALWLAERRQPAPVLP